ncbi:adenosine deaminase [Bailinhaonella thermotolerans]|uniref:Adenosine deaminase n=1 Tax=Bailinhaonella thermotolerans TaxID=1070861 RepID=A0A3A4A952_9ACTN|nr:adenosine deaminase [Bailinhaonella thermotolerans]RJL24549.1 adenosine deaminase [Bailinhaonella thermotolerans]
MIDAFIDSLPKAELHVHLVGSASPETVLELAARHPGHRLPGTLSGLRDFFEFRDFPHFAEVYEAVNEVVTTPEDVATLVLGAARDLAAQNTRYVELTVTPYSHQRLGMPMPEVTEALDIASRKARERYGIRVAYIFDIPAEWGADSVRGTLEHALNHPPEALVGFGMGGIEESRAAIRDELRDAFRAAVAAGLHSVPHAGEMTGPETMWEALEGLKAERLGHGIACVRDERLMAYLRDNRIPLEVCPTSNVCTKQVGAIEDHPFPRMLEAGLVVTLNSDDPPMFGTTLSGEYRAVARAFGLGVNELADLSRTAVTSSYLDEVGKKEILAEIDSVVAATRG